MEVKIVGEIVNGEYTEVEPYTVVMPVKDEDTPECPEPNYPCNLCAHRAQCHPPSPIPF